MSTHHKHSKWNDNGFKSRKFWFAMFAVGVLFLGMAFVTHYGVTEGIYRIFSGSVEVISGMYLVGNLTAKWVSTKAPEDKNPPPTPGQ